MSKYTTIVIDTSTEDGLDFARTVSKHYHTRAWSMDHEILRLELIEKALDKNDTTKAQELISAPDVSIYLEPASEQ